MQRKALKQLNKVTQWTSEKVFSGEKTELSREFTEFEREIDVKRLGIERLHATSMPFFENITKVKQTADPYPPAGSGKKGDKVLTTEALGLVMIDYGGELRDDYGDALSKYGRARCKLAIAQQEFGERLNENYIAGMARSLESVNDYKTFRKKLDSRRLALDAAAARLNACKKEKERPGLEAEVELARERFEEIEEETFARMQALQNESEQPFHELSDLLEAELEYHAKCRDILEELRDSWPSGHALSTPTTRPRANTASSARSIRSSASRVQTPRTTRAALDSEDDDTTPNRHRSGSTSSLGGGGGGLGGSAKKEKKGFMGGFGSFGKKGGMTISKPRRDKDAQTLNSTDEEDEDEERGFSGGGRRSKPSSPRDAFAPANRYRPDGAISPTATRHHTLPPSLRRTHTSPPTQGGRYVKALYDYATTQPDELALRVGQVVEVKSEISADWWNGESEGLAGMFPAAYCEVYVPSPTAASSLGMRAGGDVPLPPRRVPPVAGGSVGSAGGAGPGSVPMGGSRTLPPLTTRSLAPPQQSRGQSADKGYGYNSMDDLTSGSEAEGGYDDGDHHATASLSGGAQTPASRGLGSAGSHSPGMGMFGSPSSGGVGMAGGVGGSGSGAMGRSRSNTVTSISAKKGPAPPPPPSRRSASSSNVLSMATASGTGTGMASPRARAGTVSSLHNGRLGVPGAGLGRAGMDSSPEGSPFAGPSSGLGSSSSSRAGSVYGHGNGNGSGRVSAGKAVGQEASPFGASEDEDEILTDDDYVRAEREPATVPTRPSAGAGAGMTRAMSGLKLPSASDNAAGVGAGAGARVGECKEACGCDEYKQNLFKLKGNCASCYHLHET